MSAQSRLGKDPLARPGREPSPTSREALRHILNTAAAPAPEARADEGEIYKDVAGRFSKAMDRLNRLAASAGARNRKGGPDEDDPLLFLRIMAAYTVRPLGEGVNLASFLHYFHDLWERHRIRIFLDLEGIVIPVEQAFHLGRAIQACLGGFSGRAEAPSPALTLAVGMTGSGRVRLRLHGPNPRFPGGAPGLRAAAARPLVELARSGAASVLFTHGENTAELTVTV